MNVILICTNDTSEMQLDAFQLKLWNKLVSENGRATENEQIKQTLY